MTVYILPIPDALRPSAQPFQYPKHNADYGVEQDFYEYATRRTDLFTKNPEQAEWHYLPAYWTRWHLNHDYGRQGVDELQRLVDGVVCDDEKTFAICQYDDGPLVNLGKTSLFLASRKSAEGLDIPLLSSPHRKPFWLPGKRYTASFAGRIDTHPVRRRMLESLSKRSDIAIVDGDRGARYFVRLTLASYSALAPRGYGGSSFRFFEAMQLGVVPILIGDIDTRPFKQFIDWASCSFYVDEPAALPELLDSVDRPTLLNMGKRAAEIYRDHIAFGKWCGYVIRELEQFA